MIDNECSWVITQYVEKLRSLKDISKELKCGSKKVRQILNDNNIEIRTKCSNFIAIEALKYLNDYDYMYGVYVTDRMIPESIGNLIGCSAGTVVKYLKIHGIQTRNVSDVRLNNVAKRLLDNKEWLYKEYVVEHRTRRSIADELNCEPSVILRYLKLYGMEIKTRSTANIKRSALKYLTDVDWLYNEYITNNKTPENIAEYVGCDQATVRVYIDKNGINTKSYREAHLSLDILEHLSDSDYMYDQYITNKKSTVQIAELLGCSGGIISGYIKSHGIEIRSMCEAKIHNTEALTTLTDKILMEELYTTKRQTTRMIATELGCDKKTVGRYLKSHNIQIKESSYVSSHEIKIQDFLKENGIGFETSNRELIAPYELDIYVPSHNIAIEVNGLYWHSEFFKKDKNYHEMKRKMCNEQGIRLIHLYEDQINDNFELIKRFLSNVFNLYVQERVFARKCSIVENVPKSDSKALLDEFHIQGTVGHNKAVGLAFEGELVAVMLFKGNVLTRYATSKKVIGGFGKLLKAGGIKGDIITFVDLDMFDGSTYFKVGFEVDAYLVPDYKYVVGDKRIHKFNYRRKRFENDPELFFDVNMTEHQMALENKLYRIYDSGKYRMKYTQQ